MSVRFAPEIDENDAVAQRLRESAVKLLTASGTLPDVVALLAKGKQLIVLLPSDQVLAAVYANPPPADLLRTIVLYHVSTREEVRAKKNKVCPVPRYMTMANGLPLRFSPMKNPKQLMDGTLYADDIEVADYTHLEVTGTSGSIMVFEINRILKPLKLTGDYMQEK